MAERGGARVVVSIYGEECALRGDGTPEHLRGLAALVDARMRAVATRTPQLSKARVAMLTALQLAEELDRLQEALAARGGAAAPSPAPEPSARPLAAPASAPASAPAPAPAPGPASVPPPRRTRRPHA